MIEQMFVGSNTRSAGDAVNNLLPSLAAGQAQPAPPTTNGSQFDDVPSSQSVSSNLQIVTSVSSLRSTLSRSPATSIMFTSSHCPPCNAIKPYFEELARRHPKISFCLVETQLGEGAQVARMSEFGGPVTATPTFVFFKGGEKVGECKGADKRELETRIGMLELEVFPRKCLASSVSVPSLIIFGYTTAHPHEKFSLPHLTKLSKTLSPITFTAFPPLPALSSKLAASTSSLHPNDSTILTKDVISYLSSLPVPPSPAPTSPLPPNLIEPWLSATFAALENLENPTDKFPILDLLRLSLARDSSRLTSQPNFIKSLPKLLSILVKDLDQPSPSHPYLLTSLKFISNLLISPLSTSEILSNRECLENVTKLLIRILLDDKDDKMRSFGAGLGWSLVAKVYGLRSEGGGGGEKDGEEEWESELAGAVLEALGREEKSLEVGEFLVSREILFSSLSLVAVVLNLGRSYSTSLDGYSRSFGLQIVLLRRAQVFTTSSRSCRGLE